MDMRDDGSGHGEARGRRRDSGHCAPHLILRMPTRVCFRCMGRGVVLKADKTTRVNAGGSGTVGMEVGVVVGEETRAQSETGMDRSETRGRAETATEPAAAVACGYAKCPRCSGRGWVFVDEDSPLCTGECDNCIFEEDCYSPAWAHG